MGFIDMNSAIFLSQCWRQLYHIYTVICIHQNCNLKYSK